MGTSLRSVVVPLVAFLLIASACGDDEAASDTTSAESGTTAGSDTTGGSVSDVSGAVTVFAAASLTESFTEIGDAFVTEYPDSEVTFSFGASSDLVTQVNEGAPADVFASADLANMTKLTDAGNNGGEPVVFAKNSLQVVVERGNPLEIAELADLENPDLIVVTCDPEVPIGAYSEEVFTNADVTVEPDSFEEDVKAVVNKVVLGEADAGIVYTTDVIAAGDTAEGVEIPDGVNVTPEYPLAVTAEAPNPDGGAAFVELVASEAGQEILAEYGFSAP